MGEDTAARQAWGRTEPAAAEPAPPGRACLDGRTRSAVGQRVHVETTWEEASETEELGEGAQHGVVWGCSAQRELEGSSRDQDHPGASRSWPWA